MKHRGADRKALSPRIREMTERAREHARAARVAQGLPADAEDYPPDPPPREYIKLPSGDWWPADEPVPEWVAALPPIEVSVWERPLPRGKRATRRDGGR